jgi:hypothetical protein
LFFAIPDSGAAGISQNLGRHGEQSATAVSIGPTLDCRRGNKKGLSVQEWGCKVSWSVASPRKILILGASFGSLLATKLLLAGQKVSLVCRSHEGDLINSEGTRVHIPLRGREGIIEIDSRKLPGMLEAFTPDHADPSQYDLIVLAMQEPQYRCAGVLELLVRIADSVKPVMSIMNMPPLPFLARIPDLDLSGLKSCYADARVWDGFTPGLFTLASSDPQAFRPSGSPPNILRVTLATNFKVPRFEDAAGNAMAAGTRVSD